MKPKQKMREGGRKMRYRMVKIVSKSNINECRKKSVNRIIEIKPKRESQFLEQISPKKRWVRE